MKEPEVVPEKVDSPINYKVILAIIGAVVIFQFGINQVELEEERDLVISVVSFINPLSAAVAAFVVAKRYKGSFVFGKAYLSLAIAFLMVFLAEVTYLVYDLVLGIDPYPSIADLFFFLLYPFTMIHLILNIRFFNPSIHNKDKIWMAALGIVIVSAYVFSSMQETDLDSFDFAYGTIFVIGTSATLAFTALGAKTFKEGVLGKAWLILLIGILSQVIGDVWYYYLEIPGQYSLEHPVNMFWYASYWIIIYALIKHKSII